jgi:hypothetical protein
MQVQVQHALNTAEERLQRTPPPPGRGLPLGPRLDGCIERGGRGGGHRLPVPEGSEATTALKVRAAIQLKELADHILDRTEEPELRLRAESLLSVAGRIKEVAG